MQTIKKRHISLPLSCPLCASTETKLYFSDNKNAQHEYHHCAICDLVFVAPSCRLTNSAEKARYDMHDNDESDHYISFLSRLANPMLALLNQQYRGAGDVMLIPDSFTYDFSMHDFSADDCFAYGLDFGCGESHAMARLFQRMEYHISRYDIYYAPDNQVLQKQYDFIVASEVIEHLYNPKAVVEQWLSMLKPNGLLGIMTGLRPADSLFPNWWYKNDPTHVALFSHRTMDYMAQRYSLTCVFQEKNVTIFENNA